jgi:hypothetical protein
LSSPPWNASSMSRPVTVPVVNAGIMPAIPCKPPMLSAPPATKSALSC